MPALCPTTALTMEPPSVQSPFAQFWCYRGWGIVYRFLGGHYPSVFAPTDSCANPSDSPLLQLLLRSRSLCRLLPAPAVSGTFPTLSLRILPRMSGPLPRRVTTECVYLFLPPCHRPSPTGVWVGFPASSRKHDFPAERFFEAADISLCSDLRVCSPPRSFLPLRVLPQGS